MGDASVYCRLRFLGGAALDPLDTPGMGRAAAPRQLALLALLTAHQTGLCRERLAGLLTPDASPEQARHQLSDAVYFIRHAFGHAAVRQEGACLVLDRARVPSDVAAFESALTDGRPRDAVSIWGGPFLDGFHAGCGHALEEWQLDQRARYDGLLLGALERLAFEAEACGDLTAARTWWGVAVGHAPLSAHTLEGLLRVLVRSGDEALALHQYREYADRLRRDLGVAPEARLQSLAAGIRTRLVGP